MVSYLETYPNEKHPIIFKHLNDLVIDKRYSIGSYPSLERPRQKTLDEDHVQSFRSIARDYCILKSPGHTSWTTKQAQKDATFEIFHTDTVQIPVADPKSRFQTKRKDWSQTSYFNRWYLQGMTRVEVEKIFKSHFGLTIPLSSESTSDHWMPAAVKYTVEVKENVWEDRVVLFFDGFVATSLRAMKIRLKKYGHLLRAKKLGDSYLEMWRMRWAKGAEATPFIQVAKNETGSLVKPRRNPSEHINSGVDNSPKYRGRKRRTVLRQLRNRSSVPVIQQLPSPFPQLIFYPEPASRNGELDVKNAESRNYYARQQRKASSQGAKKEQRRTCSNHIQYSAEDFSGEPVKNFRLPSRFKIEVFR